MRIINVEVFNFFSYAHAKIDLSFNGLTSIAGISLGTSAFTSNGAGKSAFLDAVKFTLDGTFLRDDALVDDVVRRGQKKMWTRIQIQDAETIYSIQRGRNGKKPLLVLRNETTNEDLSAGTTVLTQEKINHLFNYSHSGFIATSAFAASSDAKGLFRAGDAERKAILESMFSVTWCGEARDIAIRKRQELNCELHKQTENIEKLRTRVEEIGEQIERLMRKHEQSDSAPSLLRMARKRLKQAKRKAKSRRSPLEIRLAEAEDKAEKLRAEMDRWERDRDEKQSALEDERAAHAVCKSTYEDATARFNKVKKLPIGKPCVTCGVPLTKKSKRKSLATLDKPLQAAWFKYDMSMADIKRAKKEFRKLPGKPDSDADARVAASKAKRALKDLNRAVDAARQEFNAIKATPKKDYQQKISALRKARKQAKQSIKKIKSEQQVTRRAIEINEACVVMFGDAGIKSQQLARYVSATEQRTTAYARRLWDDQGVKVTLSNTTTTRKGDVRQKTHFSIDIPGRAPSYGTSSNGQRVRADVCLLLATNDIAAASRPRIFDNIFVDEVFDHLDESGTEYIIELLREIAKNRPLLIITHNDKLRSIADRSYVATHDGTKSTISVDRRA